MSDPVPRQVILNHPPDRNQSAERVWLFVSIDKDGNEAPCGMLGAFGPTPMFASKWPEVERMRPIAATLARASKLRVVLREYSQATDIEEL